MVYCDAIENPLCFFHMKRGKHVIAIEVSRCEKHRLAAPKESAMPSCAPMLNYRCILHNRDSLG